MCTLDGKWRDEREKEDKRDVVGRVRGGMSGQHRVKTPSPTLERLDRWLSGNRLWACLWLCGWRVICQSCKDALCSGDARGGRIRSGARR